MGSNLLLAYLPAAKITMQRRPVLHRLIDKLSEADVNCEQLTTLSDEDDVRQMLHAHVDLLPEHPWDRRDTVEMALPHMPYPIVFTGGNSWGDSPSELFDPFCSLGALPPILRQLRKWAIEDEQFRKSGIRPRPSD